MFFNFLILGNLDFLQKHQWLDLVIFRRHIDLLHVPSGNVNAVRRVAHDIVRPEAEQVGGVRHQRHRHAQRILRVSDPHLSLLLLRLRPVSRLKLPPRF